MASPVNVVSFYRGTIWFNWLKFGWSESLDFPDATPADAAAKLLIYAKHRSWMLPNTVSIVYGRIVKVPQERYSIPLGGLPLVGQADQLTTPDEEDMDSVERSATFNFIVDNGKKAIRNFHGLPDDVINAQALLVDPPGGSWIDLVTASGNGTVNPATIDVAIKNVISYIGKNTIVAGRQQTLTIDGGQKLGYATNVITGVLARAVRNRKVGRPFGLSLGKGPIR